ncbi:MAG: SIS domain-containing protein [Deltaproteobacteria bacterium]|nr:SIS domain-containing protein [Deltaproteobacteria bacterium]
MIPAIKDLLIASASLKSSLASNEGFLKNIEASAQQLSKTAKAGGIIYACGNGGSACDAAHLAEELVARFKRERPGIKAMHFADPGTLTCWANDYEYASAYERQVKTFCSKGDTLVAISTSGNSENILRAAKAAKAAGAAVIGLTGKDGGKLAGLCDYALVVPAKETERIQEVHITVIHIWCELLETTLA